MSSCLDPKWKRSFGGDLSWFIVSVGTSLKKLCLSLGLNSSQMTLNPKLNIFLKLCSSSTNWGKKSLSEAETHPTSVWSTFCTLDWKGYVPFILRLDFQWHGTFGNSLIHPGKEIVSERPLLISKKNDWRKDGRKAIVWLRQITLILNKIQTLKLWLLELFLPESKQPQVFVFKQLKYSCGLTSLNKI